MVSSQTKQGIVVLIGAVLVHITLGVLYCFGNISPYIVSYLRDRTSYHDIRYANISWILTLMVVGQGCTMVVGGLLEKRIGTKLTVLLGCIVICVSMSLTYFTIHSFYSLICTYGVMFGFGIGIAYTPAMAVSMRWLPKYQGVVAGIVVGGFGLGALVFNPAISVFINPNNTSPSLAPYKNKPNETYYSDSTGDSALLDRVPYCFLMLTGCFIVLQGVGCLLIRSSPVEDLSKTPEKGVVDSDEADEGAEDGSVPLINDGYDSNTESKVVNMTPKEIIYTWNFWCLWFSFLFNIMGIQYCSTYWKTFGQTFIKNDLFLAGVGSAAAVFNAGSRVFWGYLGDVLGFKRVMMQLQSLFLVLYCVMYYSSKGDKFTYAALICMLFFCIGGSFSLFPTVVVKLFGPSNGAANYGMLFTSSIAGAITSSLMFSHFVPLLTAQHMQWVIVGFLLAGLMSTTLFELKPPCVFKRRAYIPHIE